jgi:signal transduction histidine kinase
MSAKGNKQHNNLGGSGEGYDVPSVIAAAHELKAPLVLIRQLALMLQQDDISGSEKSEMLQQAVLTTERALRLTSDLTRSARLEDAMFELEPMNPVALCEDIVHELTPLFKAHGREVRLHSRKHPLLLVANRDLLRRILLNFSDNALHYSEAGSPVELQLQALKNGKVIRLGVRDFGPALSGDMWKTLQKKLSKSPQSIHARPESSGLGLYIASLFADSMNGTIGVTKHRDGATFYVELQASRQLSLL